MINIEKHGRNVPYTYLNECINADLIQSVQCTEGVVVEIEILRGLDLNALKRLMKCQMLRNCSPVQLPIIGRITVCFVLNQPSWMLITHKGDVCIKYKLFLQVAIFQIVVKSEETCKYLRLKINSREQQRPFTIITT